MDNVSMPDPGSFKWAGFGGKKKGKGSKQSSGGWKLGKMKTSYDPNFPF